MQTAQNILKKLVAFPVLGGENNLKIIAFIQNYLAEFGIKSHLVENEEKTKTSLHCRIGPAVNGGAILSGHTDVVPVKGQPWDSDPFVLTEKNGNLYARGACDMKGYLACCLACVPEMVKANLKKPIYLAFSYDEEIGCLAAPALVKAINLFYTEKPQFALIGEPTMMQPVVGQKGICIYKTTVTGSAGHSSRIKQEVSAIHEAMRLVLWLENKMEQLIKDGHTDNRFSPNHTSLHIGKIKGGLAPNIISEECTFYWDIRVIPRDKIEDITTDFNAYCRERENICRERFSGFTITNIEDHPPVPSLNTPKNLAIVDLVKQLSGNNEVTTVAYAAEAGQFAAGGFEAIICGPGSIAQAHRANEFISIEQLEKGVEYIRKLIALSC